MLISSGLPIFLWEEAMRHGSWIRKRVPHKALKNKTPYEVIKKVKPNLTGIQEFGTAAYVKNNAAGKLQPRARVGRFVGYDSESKGYRIYWPDKRTISVERNVVFNTGDIHMDSDSDVIPGNIFAEEERTKVVQRSPIGRSPTLEENDKSDNGDQDEEPVGDQEENSDRSSVPLPSAEEEISASRPGTRDRLPTPEPNTGRGFRARPPPGTYKKAHHGLAAVFDDPFFEGFDSSDSVEWFEAVGPNVGLIGVFPDEPKTLDEALRLPEAQDWAEAHKYEIGRLEKMGVWEIVDLPKGQKAIPYSEVFRDKRGPDGVIEARRARIVAGGHRQIEGVDYDETFAAAAKMPSVRVVLANAAIRDWEIHHVDVKSAYLNAPIDKVVYMKPPQGVLKPGQEGKVCKLLKGLYGLKQAGRLWHQTMSDVFIKKLGFRRSKIDHSVFFKFDNGERTIVAVATDDMALTSEKKSDIDKFKSELWKHFEISDKGEMSWFLGFEVRRDRKERTISINQRSYIEAMVEKFGLKDAKPQYVPMDPGSKYSKSQSPMSPKQEMEMRNVPYAQAIGSALWPIMVYRADAAAAIGILSQFIQNPGRVHWQALKTLIAYLGTTKHLWLSMGGSENVDGVGYCDSDWAEQPGRHSISGYCFKMGMGCVTWSSKKQNLISLSSTEAEYIAQNHAAREALWLRTFLAEINGESEQTMTLWSDNQGAMDMAKDPKFHSRTKHIDIRYHFIREVVADEKIELEYIATENNPADILTKPLTNDEFERKAGLLGIRAIRGGV
jgi:hypothetical protein